MPARSKLYLGEAQVLVSVYNKKIRGRCSDHFIPKMLLENNKWFAKYSKDKYKTFKMLN
jgi:hypothetical protein